MAKMNVQLEQASKVILFWGLALAAILTSVDYF